MPNPEIPIESFEVFATGIDHPECVAFGRDGILWAGGEARQVYRITSVAEVETVVDGDLTIFVRSTFQAADVRFAFETA